MSAKLQRKLINLRYRLKKSGYLINDEAKVIVLPEEENRRSRLREFEMKKLGYDLQNNLFKNNSK